MTDTKIIDQIIKQVSKDTGIQIDKNDPVVISALILNKSLAAELSEIKTMVAAGSAQSDNEYIEANRAMIAKNAASVKSLNGALQAWATKADETFEKINKRLSDSETNETVSTGNQAQQDYVFYGVVAAVLLGILNLLM